MLDAGGGGGGTPWGSMTVDVMQQLIQNPSVDKHWELVTGWRRSADLINQHRSQVRNYRENLAAVWPPEKNKAAAAYLTRLDDLIANLTETYEAAVANHTAFSTATLSISLAQKDMDEIYREYSTNAQLLADSTGARQSQQASGTPMPSPSPSGEQPPVAPGRQEELRQKAVTLLSGVSGELAQAQVRLVRPTLYDRARQIDEPPIGKDGGYAAPPIPPITPIASTNTSTTRSKRPSITFPTDSNSGSGISSPAAPRPGIGVQQPGLVLGGTTPPVTNPPPINIAPPPPALPSGANGLPNPGILPPATNPVLPNGGAGLVPPVARGSGPGAGLPRDGVIRSGNAGGMHAMPPGGLIGGAPGVGLGQPAGSRSGANRVNPIGGVIGEGQPHGRAGSRGIAGEHTVAYGSSYAQGSRRSSSHDQPNDSRWDPDNPWATAEGVDPVLLPAREQRIDPGPAIGLH